MLLTRVRKALRLSKNERRRFVLLISGGLDSSVLLHLILALKKKFPIQLELLHLNFHLRGVDSDLDETLVRKFAKRYRLKLHCLSSPLKKSAAIQEQARKLRLKALDSFPENFEVLEGHHSNDQVETFLFRLFRGSSLKGLSAMREFSLFGSRKIWRPLLTVEKAQLAQYAKTQRIEFRTDLSNSSSDYDRNFLRLQLIPLIERRFPSFHKQILRLLEQIQMDEADHQNELLRQLDQLQRGQTILWEPLRRLSESSRRRLLNLYFSRRFGLQLTHRQIVELSQKILESDAFTVNAPKGYLIRGRRAEEPYVSLIAPLH